MGRYSIFLQLITAQNNNSSFQLQIPSYECVIDAPCHWQITIGALSQLMKKMPAFRKQVTQVIEMPHMPWKSAITWHLGHIHSTGCLKYCRNPLSDSIAGVCFPSFSENGPREFSRGSDEPLSEICGKTVQSRTGRAWWSLEGKDALFWAECVCSCLWFVCRIWL